VPADATAVVLNVTVVNPIAQGYVIAYPAGAAQPFASNINYVAGEVVPNLVEVGVGALGDVSLFSSAGTDVVVDVEGYTASTAAGGGGAGLYDPLSSPVRICDTRAGNPSGLSAPNNQCNGDTVAANGTLPVKVANMNGIPAGATAAVLNVTDVNPQAQGFLTVFPQGSARPLASNLNYTAGQTTSNRVIVPLSVGGPNAGEISVFSAARADVVVDVAGYYTAVGGAGSLFSAEPAPVRICDTRSGNPSTLSGGNAQCNGLSLGTGGTRTVQVSGLAGVPSGATAVAINLTGVSPSAQTFLTVYPNALPNPLVSDLNEGPGDVRANMVVATLSSSGTITIYNAAGSMDVVVDVLGWYSTPAAAPANVKWVQGASVSTGTQVTSTTLQLSKAVGAGDLLVGWFGQYSSSGQVQVSDSLNGAWTRANASTTFGSHGDLAIFYVQNSEAASSLTITVSAATATYLQGAVSEFSGIATAGALDQSAAASGTSTSVDSGATGPAGAGELVVGGIITGGQPGTVTPGSSQGQPFTMGTQTSAGSADLEYVLGSTAGTQDARATLSSATDWYAAVATFVPASVPPPSVPTGLASTSDTTSSVGLRWTASTDSSGTLSGYTVYRNGNKVGTTGSLTTTYTDSTVAPSTPYQYTVDAFDTNGNHSAQSQALSVTTPAATSQSPIKKVLVIMDENQSSDDVFPSGSNPTAAMPYLWSLAQEYGYANDWSDIGHPSQPNYLAIFGGDAEGLPNDCAVGPGCSWPGPTVFSQAIAAGGTAKSYEEGMTANCEPTTSGFYDFNHNPWVYYDDPTDEAECAADDVPSGTPQSGALDSDIMSGALPTVGLLKPTLLDDTTDGTFATADSWLESWISLIQSGPDWKSGTLAIVVTFDESDEDGGENVPFVLIAPGVSGAVVTPALNHYALTRFLDEVAGASLLGNADTEPDIAPLFGVTVSG
jgi:hypothetical protein